MELRDEREMRIAELEKKLEDVSKRCSHLMAAQLDLTLKIGEYMDGAKVRIDTLIEFLPKEQQVGFKDVVSSKDVLNQMRFKMSIMDLIHKLEEKRTNGQGEERTTEEGRQEEACRETVHNDSGQ